MDLTEIRQILELMETHDLSSFQLETKDFKVRLRRGPEPGPVSYLPTAAPLATAPAGLPAPAPGAAASAPAAAPAADPGAEIPSPMVGTFYRSPSPDAAPFVEVGSRVKAGQVVCIIEAMKVMNEIKSTLSGTIVAPLVEDGTPVQFGEGLFSVKPD